MTCRDARHFAAYAGNACRSIKIKRRHAITMGKVKPRKNGHTRCPQPFHAVAHARDFINAELKDMTRTPWLSMKIGGIEIEQGFSLLRRFHVDAAGDIAKACQHKAMATTRLYSLFSSDVEAAISRAADNIGASADD